MCVGVGGGGEGGGACADEGRGGKVGARSSVERAALGYLGGCGSPERTRSAGKEK